MRSVFLVLCALLPVVSCGGTPAPRARSYEVTGQVLGTRPEIREVRLAHEEIPGFMPAMTMSFGVKDASLLQGLTRGDMVRGTLLVTETDAWLSRIEKTGRAPIVEAPEPDESFAPAAPAPDLLEPGEPVPDATFTDQDGAAFTLADSRGRAVALTFIHTRCPLPNFCPRMDRQFLAVQKAVAARQDLSGRVQLVSVSFDPAFDTPAVLKQHAASIGADQRSWRFVTGDEATIDRVATRFGVSIVRETEGGLEITHNLRTAVVGPDGRLRKVFPGADWTPEEVVTELAAALAP